MVRSLRSLVMLAATLMLTASCGVPYGNNGLGAIDPPQIWNSWGSKDIGTEDGVSSLTPTIVWESFPQQDDPVQAAALAGQRVEDVTYELRLRRRVVKEQWMLIDLPGDEFLFERSWPGRIVYERRGLLEPRHTVEVPLEPSQSYNWSVRARFRLDGRERVNQWSSLTWNKCPETSRMPVIPDPCAYRLTTPAATR